MAMDGSPPSKKKKLCKDVGGSSEEASSEEEAYQSTTSPKKSQEKLSARHSGSSSQEQTPQPETSRSQTFAAQTSPKDLQETEPSTSAGTSKETEERKCPKCGHSFIKEALDQHDQLDLCKRPGKLTPSTGTSSSQTSPSQEETPPTPQSPISSTQTSPKDLQETEPSTSAGTSEETEERKCPKCGHSFIKEALDQHVQLHLCKRPGKLTPSTRTSSSQTSTSQEQTPPTPRSPISPAQTAPEDLQATEPSTSAGTFPISLAENLSAIDQSITLLETYRRTLHQREHSPSAGISRTSEETEESHTCSICGASSTSVLLLVYHLLTYHNRMRLPNI